ncbi:response regulator [Nostoc linckia]|uniref:response regulator n=1 Tax=Nostoc linckia TaxID=92942 RepID=UPI000BFFD562|nr:response regulator [Nostoc linckia]PHJ94518.1 transcriptional regulator [Nostoc linckia z9]
MDKVRILVVEDDPLVLVAVEEALLEAGFEVVTAGSANDAVQTLESEHTALKAVLTDIRLGKGASGWDVGRHARTLSPSMPVIYVSGDSAQDWAVHGVPKSVMLSKPFAFPQLVTALATLLNEADQAAALSGSDTPDGSA